MNRKFNGAFFDFDGTIADTGEGIFNCVQIALKETGFPPATPEQLRAFIGPPIFDSFKIISGKGDEVAEEISAVYRRHYNETGILQFRLYDGIPELFDELKKNGVKISIVSSKPVFFVMKILNKVNMSDVFDYIACPQSDSFPETKAELIERACKNLGLEKSETVMIGDRLYDMEGAVQTGVTGIGAVYGYGSADELTNSGAKYLVYNTDDIKNIILSM